MSRLASLRSRLNLQRDPRFVVRVALGVLLGLNLLALSFVIRPWGGSAEELDSQLVGLQNQIAQRQLMLRSTRAMASKVETARAQGDQFLNGYFLDRRTTASTIDGELRSMAQRVGINFREHTFTFDPIEGSDTLSMMTVNANYEGTYANVLRLVNEMDRSQRFLIIESLQAAPLQKPGQLRVTMKIKSFVREAS